MNIKTTIKSDSMYSINCITKWFGRFETKGFINKNGVLQKNIDIIMGIKLIMEGRNVTFEWVKGHSLNK